MWRAFFANYRKFLRPNANFRLLWRSVLPCLDYWNSRWPAHADISLKVDAVQRKMIAIILRPKMRSEASVVAFVRRWNRLAGVEAPKGGVSHSVARSARERRLDEWGRPIRDYQQARRRILYEAVWG